MSTTAVTNATRELRRHPVRGALWGFLLGLGIALYAVLFAVIPFGDWIPLLLCVLVGVAIGLSWAYFAPPKGAKEPPQAAPDDRPDDSVPDEPSDDSDVGGDDESDGALDDEGLED